MTKLTDKKEIRMFSMLFMLIYFASYITRINYGAVISEMVRDTGYTKAALALALTGSSIGYGIGQIISGGLGDKFQPKYLIASGFCVTILTNLLIPVCSSPYQMLVVWSVNGLSQAFLWPPLVRLMSAIFTPKDYSEACVWTNIGSSGGTIFVYLSAPLFITLWGWKSVFFVSAFFAMLILIMWMKKCCLIDSREKQSKTDTSAQMKTGYKALFSPIMLAVMLAIIIQGALRDGITTWMPSYISETYSLSTKISILTNVALPIFSIVCFQASERLYRKVFKNPLMCSAAIYGLSVLAAALLWIFSGGNAVISVIASALFTGCMHGINLILICMVPTFFYKYGTVSAATGILNSCTYIGSAVSTYVIAVISDNYGWNATLGVWFALACAGFVICLLCVRPWEHFTKK